MRCSDEYTPSGTLVQSVELPTPPSANRRVTGGTATSEGRCRRTGATCLAGFDADPGQPAGGDVDGGDEPGQRDDGNGVVDSSTAISDAQRSGHQAAVTDDGSCFWAVEPAAACA
jgi:hypothetical protein